MIESSRHSLQSNSNQMITKSKEEMTCHHTRKQKQINLFQTIELIISQ